jgi:hypothetical protein
MASLTITIPDGQLARVRDSFALAYNYQATIPDPANPGATIPNPENKVQFMQRKVREYIKEVVKGQEAVAAAEAARTTAAAAVESGVTLS